MSTFDWQRFLKNWSRDYLSCVQELDSLDIDVLESEWLGFPGATEVQLAAAEARLAVKLPPSYREFLKVSNGWRQTTPFIYRILAIEEVEWFSLRHREWIMSFSQKISAGQLASTANNPSNGTSTNYSIPDSEYFIYGNEQDCSKIRVEYLNACLSISEKGESSIYLLNSRVINEAQEWEAWFFGDWLPGADRYPSFQTMMEAEYRNFLELREVL
ncbi:MAG: SMI1/KNR4 family protein [Leptolyngbyaceae cyanobacterium SM2_5_2]|nr:SMI1/KNR4 family protein [Leptolyngbyaceae cyanobacterium SM2_5_2]